MSLTLAFLEVVDGPGKGERVVLRGDQVMYVGRLPHGADKHFPANATMSATHFSARCINGHCEIKDLQSANGTWLNEKRIKEAMLHPGEEIRAGRATFRFVVQGQEPGERREEPPKNGQDTVSDLHLSEVGPQAPPAPLVPPASPVNQLLKTGLQVPLAGGLKGLNLGEAVEEAVVEEMPVPKLVELLANHEKFVEALKVAAHALTKRSAVEWACRCVRAALGDQLGPQDEACLTAAEAWVQKPEENERRQAQAAAEAAGHKTPASWAATAAFWSSGSMGPPTAPVVPPAPHLTAHAASGAVMLAAVARYPEKATEKYRQFLLLANEMMQPRPRA